MSAEKLRKQKEKMKNVVKTTSTMNKKEKKKLSDGVVVGDDNRTDDIYDNNALAMANEIESERTYRRIATRGVVALFNAISKHRADAEAKIADREEEKKRRAEAAMDGNSLKKRKKDSSEETNNSATTKRGFLDMIKKSSVTTSTTIAGGSSSTRVVERGTDSAATIKQHNGTTPARPVGWNALKDDFMMNSKLKDWDKEISDDEE